MRGTEHKSRSSIIQFSPSSWPFPSTYFQIFPTLPCSRATSIYVILLMWQTKFHKKVKSTALIIFDRIIDKFSVHAMKPYAGLEL